VYEKLGSNANNDIILANKKANEYADKVKDYPEED
jgi:hypothetical protein